MLMPNELKLKKTIIDWLCWLASLDGNQLQYNKLVRTHLAKPCEMWMGIGHHSKMFILLNGSTFKDIDKHKSSIDLLGIFIATQH